MVCSTSCLGIGGKIKLRYSDFIVEEIARDGRIARVERFLEEGALDNPTKIIVPENPEKKDFLHFDLEKFNSDVSFCIKRLTRYLQLSQKRIGYAGLKDKRAITCQRISLFQPPAERLEQFSSKLMDLRNAEWSNERIEIGSLKGNRFTITIRALELEKKEIEERIKDFFAEAKKDGIANFFGEQRFGGIRQITHRVGKEFVKGNMEEAVMLYLTAPAEKEEEAVKAARKNLAETRDFSRAVNEFPNEYRFERAIIHHLCKHPKDFVNAFGNLPKSIRFLFTHAYQSHLFNRIIEERLKLGFGLKQIDGDVLEDGIPAAALFGFESVLADGKAGEIEKKVLGEEGTELKDFFVKQMPELSSKGSRKKIVLALLEPELLEICEDEFNDGKLKAIVRFSLEKGNYATTVLEELMKTRNA